MQRHRSAFSQKYFETCSSRQGESPDRDGLVLYLASYSTVLKETAPWQSVWFCSELWSVARTNLQNYRQLTILKAKLKDKVNGRQCLDGLIVLVVKQHVLI